MKTTKPFQTFLLPQTVLAVSRAEQGLLEQPGFLFPQAGGSSALSTQQLWQAASSQAALEIDTRVCLFFQIKLHSSNFCLTDSNTPLAQVF